MQKKMENCPTSKEFMSNLLKCELLGMYKEIISFENA